jgi:hypothetical protein
MPDEKTSTIISNLVNLLNKGNSHASLDDALKNIPFDLLNKIPEALPYSIWQLAEHIRISQSDILQFSKDSKYESPKWPQGYWPSSKSVSSEKDWKDCIEQIKNDRAAFIELLKNAGDDLYKPFPYGDGQTLLREALVLADHNSYHTGEIIVLRRLLNDWK